MAVAPNGGKRLGVAANKSGITLVFVALRLLKQRSTRILDVTE